MGIPAVKHKRHAHPKHSWFLLLFFGIGSPLFLLKALQHTPIYERELQSLRCPMMDLLLVESLSSYQRRNSRSHDSACELGNACRQPPSPTRDLQQESLQRELIRQQNTQAALPVPPHTHGAFLHVGKTGGSTLSEQMRNGCHSFRPKPCRNITEKESFISKYSTYIHTPDFRRLGRGNYSHFDFYVASLRDPLTRFLSAFVYMHPSNKLESEQRFYRRLEGIYKCFPTVEEFTNVLGDYNFREMEKMGNCTLLAKHLLFNKLHEAHHFFYDTKFIHQKLPTDSPLLVVRNEHLWHDWVTANQWLGQDEVAVYPDDVVRDFSNKSLSVSRRLSDIGRQRLCRALEREYHAYWRLIERAVNLTPEEKMATAEMARKSCPDIRLPQAVSETRQVQGR
jgi:hypothetical protein